MLLITNYPDDPLADGMANLFDSIRRAVASGRPHRMAIQRYDVRNSDGKLLDAKLNLGVMATPAAGVR